MHAIRWGLAVVLGVALAHGGERAKWTEAAKSFGLGPIPATVDLRNMQTRCIVERSCVALDATAARRHEGIAAGQWQAWRDAVRKAVAEGLGDMPFGERGCPLNVRVVSRHERPGYVVENVLFDSLPGLDVNGSVYLPLASKYPPPWRAIVVPVGHSAKTKESYQIPAQAFARMGYVAITFDPPGQGGEKKPGNDHFVDGVRCFLTGESSNRFFVIDAIRCIDYLATRPDVDMSNGVGMTGVSGGGTTTLFATVLDERIRVSGPSCCAVPLAMHPVLDAYAPCPETLAIARFGQYDEIDLLVAAMPTPVLLMAGAKDEVFTEAMSRDIAADVSGSFEQAGFGDKFRFFLDPGGHAYTVAMAVEFTKEMDRWVAGIAPREWPDLKREDFEMAPDEILACNPRTDRNMRTVTTGRAVELRAQRAGTSIPEAARTLMHVEEAVPVPESRAGEPQLVWYHYLQEILLKHEGNIELPATFFYPARQGWKGAALLYFDDRGRWTDLHTGGMLAGLSGALSEETNGPAILTVDVRGWGDSRPNDIRYDIAGWGSRDRWNAYVSAALGDPVMAMRIRDGLAALAYLRTRPEVDASKIVVGGRGLGALVALHIAAIDDSVAGAVAADGLASYEQLASAESYAWPHEAFFPGVLKHYDLPELAAALKMPALILNPLNAQKKSLTKEDCDAIYGTLNIKSQVHSGWDEDTLVRFVRDTLSGGPR
ncbi:MAG: dienelactone hydrolase family protein [Candidatus Hydrogenedentes bacterium]|nr:dienelactone hydrolase family protein [Candidatus Hydrogenedentota bacterium]